MNGEKKEFLFSILFDDQVNSSCLIVYVSCLKSKHVKFEKITNQFLLILHNFYKVFRIKISLICHKICPVIVTVS